MSCWALEVDSMSRRTSEADKAVRAAWILERQLVRVGKGTRDWTPEQQRDILDPSRGKAYDDDGKAFEGHHMKSVESFPEYQGDSENIQFLSRSEHLNAHNGDFQNSTNGFYNPNTMETRNFGSNKYNPCEVIELSKPVIRVNDKVGYVNKNTKKATDGIKTAATVTSSTKSESKISAKSKTANYYVPRTQSAKQTAGGNRTQNVNPAAKGKSSNGFLQFLGEAGKFLLENSATILQIVSGVSNTVNAVKTVKNTDYMASTYRNDIPNISSQERSEIIDRTSPREHTVQPHRQRYNGVWKEKKGYTLGKNKDD